jgi:light-regulated signal transduction histidine kinase (bacteriophytochrome)
MSELKVQYKIFGMAFLLAGSVLIIYYFHMVMEMNVVYTHFLYIPIILATLWWKRKGLFVPIFLAIILNLRHFYGIQTEHIEIFYDQIRSVMFILTGLIVAELSNKIAKGEEVLRKSHEDLKQYSVELEAVNEELEAFNYSVSHDLRSPLRSIDGFSQALLEDYNDELDAQGKDYLKRVRAASQTMGHLIDDLLNLSRITRSEMKRERVDMSALVQAIAEEHKDLEPDREVEFIIQKGVITIGDKNLLKVALENLVDNAWKFTGNHQMAKIEFGITQVDGKSVFFLRDNGVGFDMAYANKLFGAFQRLHASHEFPGSGIGLATVQRIIHRHGGQVWAKGALEQGATFYFTLRKEG